MKNPERWLKILLLLFGLPAAVAIVPFVMPWSWMAATHESLGMGVLPDKPIVNYLARYASAFSAFYGFLLLLLMTDRRAFRVAGRYAGVVDPGRRDFLLVILRGHVVASDQNSSAPTNYLNQTFW